jgi:hypothetical protein
LGYVTAGKVALGGNLDQGLFHFSRKHRQDITDQ